MTDNALTRQQREVLAALSSTPLSLDDLCERFDVTRRSMAGTINSLVRNGYATRVVDRFIDRLSRERTIIRFVLRDRKTGRKGGQSQLGDTQLDRRS